MSEWISVEERLPEENIRVLAAGLGVVTIDALYRGVWWCTETGDASYGITHWMPLPEPPGEEDDHG